MTRNVTTLTLGILLFALTSCKTTATSVIYGDSYDDKKNQTTLTIIPYGNITMPDKWKKTHFSQTSRQNFFTNGDSTTLGIAKAPKEKYPVYKPNQTDKEFVTAFEKWDAEYYEKHGLYTKILNDKSDNGYIVWQVTGNHLNTIFIYCCKNNYVYNISTTSTKWTDEKMTTFVTELYNAN